MKVLHLALALLFLIPLAHAEFEEKCENSEVKELTGKSGSCRVMVVPKKVVRTGRCTALYNNILPCAFTYNTDSTGPVIALTCGENLDSASSQEMAAQAVGYDIATIIKKEDGKDLIQTDKNDYVRLSNGIFDMTLTYSIQTGTVVNGIITTEMNGKREEMSNVICSDHF